MGESGDVVSNQGLMDLLAALSWVYHNIEVFGGDPGRVTLFGHSTGAAIINFLLVSPAAVPGNNATTSLSNLVGMSVESNSKATQHHLPTGVTCGYTR